MSARWTSIWKVGERHMQQLGMGFTSEGCKCLKVTMYDGAGVQLTDRMVKKIGQVYEIVDGCPVHPVRDPRKYPIKATRMR
jgi:hypothetical protein